MKKFLILISIFSLLVACHTKKAPVKEPVKVEVVQQNLITNYGTVDTLGNIVVVNIAGDTMLKGNVHDSIVKKVPCKTCKNKGISVCERYRKENLRLWMKLQNCEKGDYYIPSKKTKLDSLNDAIKTLNKTNDTGSVDTSKN